MTEKIRLDYQMFRWGPLLVKFKIPDDMRKKFLEEAYASDKNYEKNLAGVITKEVGFRDIDMFQPFFHTIFEIEEGGRVSIFFPVRHDDTVFTIH